MNKPEMIIFDYGSTLLCEPDWSSERGNAELMKYIVKNPNNCTIEDVGNEFHIVFGEIEKVRKAFGYDISARVGNRLALEHLGIELSLTPLEHEILFWTAASPGAIMPDADTMLDYIHERGIRTAVISNNVWSGEALKDRFDRLLPDNRFEFIMSSSDYMIGKPDKRLFETAVLKSGLPADKVWYCGNNFDNDVMGAFHAGIYPVYYRHDPCDHADVDFDYLTIKSWLELIDVLERLK